MVSTTTLPEQTTVSRTFARCQFRLNNPAARGHINMIANTARSRGWASCEINYDCRVLCKREGGSRGGATSASN
jgi:hypothetical protein